MLEFAYTLQFNAELSKNVWDEDAWKAVMAQDGEDSHITQYATTDDVEDFAETFVVWLITRGLHREELTDDLVEVTLDVKKKIPNRLEFLDNRFQRLHKD